MDALCWDDLDAFGAELDDPLEELRQDLYHRTIEPPGSNLDDPDRGFGLEGRLSSGVRAGTINSSLQHELEAELKKDDRVTDASVTILQTAAEEYSINIQVVANEQLLGIVLVSNGNGVTRIA